MSDNLRRTALSAATGEANTLTAIENALFVVLGSSEYQVMD
jgi:hypothetical protein